MKDYSIGYRKAYLTLTNILGKNEFELTCVCGLSFVTERRSLSDKSRMKDCGCRLTGVKAGDQFDKWTAIERENPATAPGRLRMIVECICGKREPFAMTALVAGKIPTCYCTRGNDQVGKRFGRLTIVAATSERRNSSIVFLCKCDCGKFTKTIISSLNRGNTSSCGCLQREVASARGKAGMPVSEVPGYATAHRKISLDYGLASEHECHGCKVRKADDWAYDHLDADEIVSTGTHGGMTYSLKPSHYMALCIPCHNKFDADHRAGFWNTIVNDAVYIKKERVVQDNHAPRQNTERELKRQISHARNMIARFANKDTDMVNKYADKIARLEIELSKMV